MMRESKIYAKEEQIKLIDNILCSLCSLELNSDGRKYLKKMKDKIQHEIDYLKQLDGESSEDNISKPLRGFRYKLLHSLRALW